MGVIADQTGPLSFVGLANANVARMVVGDINARGGLLGRHLELVLEDSATDDAVAAAKAAKLVEDDQVDVVFGGIYSSTRQAIKGPVVVEGKTLYIYPEQYEGQESDPLIFCTGPVPAQQVDPLIPWLMRETGAKTFYLPSADYIWPHVLNARVKEVVAANGGSIVGEEYFPLDHMDYRGDRREDHRERRGRRVQHDRAARGDAVLRGAVRLRLREPRRPARLHVLRRELPQHGAGRPRRGALRLPRLLPGRRRPVQPKLLEQYDALYPGDAKFTGGGACSGLYRGLRLWAAAVTEAGSLTQDDVIAALDHAEIDEGPGGPAAMVPGQHHLRLNMYIAQARSGRFEIVESLGAIDPQERLVGHAGPRRLTRARPRRHDNAERRTRCFSQRRRSRTSTASWTSSRRRVP